MTSPDFPTPEESEGSESGIQISCEDISHTLHEQDKIIQWLATCIEQEGFELSRLNYIFCSDTYLHQLNIKYLNHDTLTDVITFPYSEIKVEGDIFISIDRIKDNAEQMGISSRRELHRVMIHGLLHLMHFKDKTEAEISEMRSKENQYLQLLME